MNRNEFLTQSGRFPVAPRGCRSLARWTGEPGWVAGQVALLGGENRLLLTSAQTKPLEIQCRLPLPVQPGDHVAVFVESVGGIWQAKELMLLVAAEVAGRPRGHSEWRPFVERIHDFFGGRGFVEIETPSLVDCPGMEPALEPFQVSPGQFLPTSPEIHLKKALCLGWTDIYEIKSCFRRDELSPHHQPEFLMLEWYRAYAGLDTIISDLEVLLEFAGAPKPRVTTFAELFRERLNLTLTPATSSEDLRGWCQDLSIEFSESDSSTDLFHRIWLAELEPNLEGTVIIRDFPIEQAALARISDSGWADRLELYWDGVEIANAFHEVNDPEEQRQRWRAEEKERERLGRTRLEGDGELIEMMKRHGLPPTGGVALGLDRLFMKSHGIIDIRNLRPFPYR